MYLVIACRTRSCATSRQRSYFWIHKYSRSTTNGLNNFQHAPRPPPQLGVSAATRRCIGEFRSSTGEFRTPPAGGIPPILAPRIYPGSTQDRPGSTLRFGQDPPHISGTICHTFGAGSTPHFGWDLTYISARNCPAFRPASSLNFWLGSALQIKPRHQVPPTVVLGGFAVLLGSFSSHPPLCWRSFLMYFGSFSTPR